MIVGELGFCSEKRRSACVRAVDFVTAYEIDYNDFMEILQNSTKEDVVRHFVGFSGIQPKVGVFFPDSGQNYPEQ
jgi:CRP-like cAMP-binding protein